MSDENTQEETEEITTEEEVILDAPAPLPVKSELDTLKERATQMGIKFHHKIGVKKLKGLIQDKIDGKDEEKEEKKEPVAAKPKVLGRRVNRQNELRKEAAKLVRIRIACMNPNKRDWEGEIFTVSNSVVGTFKKYVPFNAEEGWHVPNIIYKHLLDRKCQVFQKKRNSRGVQVSTGKLINEFAIEVLPPLTAAELKTLATKQAMARGQED